MASRDQDLVNQIVSNACKTAPCFANIETPPSEDNLLQDLRPDTQPALRMAALVANRMAWSYAEHAARTERIAERAARILAENTRHLIEAPLAVSANAVGTDASSWLYEAGMTEGLRVGAMEALKLWADLKSNAHSCDNCLGSDPDACMFNGEKEN